MTRSDFDFDVISGPSEPTRPPAPAPKREEREDAATVPPVAAE